MRLLFAPYRRKIPVKEGEVEAEVEATSESGKTGDDKSTVDDSMTDRSQGSEFRENIDIQRMWFNLVCYGLPNLIVAQV